MKGIENAVRRIGRSVQNEIEKRKGKEKVYGSGEWKENLVLRIQFFFELGDFTLLGGGKVLGIVPTHLLSICALLLLLLLRFRPVEKYVVVFTTTFKMHFIC